MARRLTTIQSAIKRFQVRPLVRSHPAFLASFLSFSGLVVKLAVAKRLTAPSFG
jgi:hypothetical protein